MKVDFHVNIDIWCLVISLVIHLHVACLERQPDNYPVLTCHQCHDNDVAPSQWRQRRNFVGYLEGVNLNSD